MSSTPPALELREEMLAAIERELRAVADELEGQPHGQMARMVEYHFGWEKEQNGQQGKRVRPLLALLVCTAAGGVWQRALPAAAAIELIHNFSLIHDDIEDGSDTRRGRPTLWKEWGLPQALNTGDALLILSRIAAHRIRQVEVLEETVLAVLQTLDRACLQLTIGQHLDLAFEARESVPEDEYLTMIHGKTSALLAASAATGARLADASPAVIDAYGDFGDHLGMAFQIQDDILGIWGQPERTGKPAADDLLSHKKTLPVIFGLTNSPSFLSLWQEAEASPETVAAMRAALEGTGARAHAQALAARHTEQALQLLDDARPQGPAAQELRNLAAELLGRDH